MAAHHEIPDGMSPDARETWPSRELIDSWLGDSWDFELRPGETIPVDSEEAARQARRFREVLGRYCSGVTVVTTLSEGRPIGMACQSFTSVSLDPPLVAFLPTRQSRSFAAIQRAGHFCVNFLAADQEAISNQMAGRGEDKFAGVDWVPTARSGSPLLTGTIGHVDCAVHAVHEAGDHYIVVGRVLDLDLAAAEDGPADPLLYYQGRYRTTAE